MPDLLRPSKLNLNTDSDGTLGGLIPSELVFPETYALVKEKFPAWLTNWVGAEKEIVEEREMN